MLAEQECERKVRCPDCNKSMYTLKGALKPIYVCSYCGTSIDQEELQKIEGKNKKKNYGDKNILINNLFPHQFMKKYTDFTSFSEFINQCEFFSNELENLTKDQMQNLPERKMNRYVRENTCFTTWDQMFEKAVELYLKM